MYTMCANTFQLFSTDVAHPAVPPAQGRAAQPALV